MTIKLYENDSYMRKFEGKVISCREGADGFYVELDRTAFFPNQGGQSCDKGLLNGLDVLNVVIEGESVFHVLPKALTDGTEVIGEIDFEHRFRNMQMHSGEHIFSGTVNNLFGFNNVGFHLSDNSATMDFDGKLTPEQIRDIEQKVNRIIFENRRIIASYPSKEELKNIDYRSKKEIDGDLRLVEVEGVDICACCAPHVSLTGEIGLFKVVNVQNYKSGVRIDYLCGIRALEYFYECTDSLSSISKLLSVKAGSEADGVKALLSDNRKLSEELANAKKSKVDFAAAGAFSKDGFSILTLETDMSGFMKYAVDVMHLKYGTDVAIFAGDDENGYRYMIEASDKDLTELSKLMKEKLSAKGGGRRDSIQGSVVARFEDLISVL